MKKNESLYILVMTISIVFVFWGLFYLINDDYFKFANYDDIDKFISVLVISVFPLFIIVKYIFTFAQKQIYKESSTEKLRKDEVEKYVKEIFNSNYFFTAFKNAIPSEKGDNKLGLNYIPYLLKNTEIKRDKYFSDSQYFLKTSAFLSVVFSVVIIYFGSHHYTLTIKMSK